MSKTVTVVGGGAIGLSTAWELSQRGYQVTLIDRSSTGKATSWAGAGILPPANRKTSSAPIDCLRGLSHELFPQWAEKLISDTGIDPGLRQCGGMYLAETRGEIAAMCGMTDYWKQMSIECIPLTASELFSFEPSLATWFQRVSNATAWYVPDESQLRPPRYLRALAAACAKSGVRFIENTEVTDIRCVNGHAQAQYQGVWHESEHFVLTTGAWTGRVASSLELELSIVPIRGQILLLKTAVPLVTSVINMGNRYVLAREDGHTLVGSNEEEKSFELGTTDSVLESLYQFATHLLPELASAERTAAWSGLRPMTYDRFPMIGHVPGIDNLYIAAGHYRSGLHLSPGTAVLMADIISESTPPIPIDAFHVGKQQRSNATYS